MATFLADKSALTRRETRPEVRDALEPLLLAGEIATCAIVDLELLYSATSRATYRALSEALRGMPRIPIEDAGVRRALEVQAMLADLAVLHYDADFELIAQLTGQPTRWIVPRGSVS
jgi:predicted nucleic acid-binding protein